MNSAAINTSFFIIRPHITPDLTGSCSACPFPFMGIECAWAVGAIIHIYFFNMCSITTAGHFIQQLIRDFNVVFLQKCKFFFPGFACFCFSICSLVRSLIFMTFTSWFSRSMQHFWQVIQVRFVRSFIICLENTVPNELCRN